MNEEQDITVTKSKTKIQPKWKNAPTMADLDADRLSAESSQDEFRAKLLEWELIRNGGKEIKPSKIGKSTARPLLVRKVYEWKYSALEDPILSSSALFKLTGRTYADTAAAKQNGSVINYQWNTKVQKTKLVSDIIHTLVDEGTVIVKTGWVAETELQQVEKEVPTYASPEESYMLMQKMVESGKMSPEQAQAMLETGEPMQVGTEIQMVEEEVLTRNHPKYEVCVNANVTIDPTCDGVVADALFAIHEYDTSYAELKADEYYVDEEGNENGIYHNIDYIQTNGERDEYDEHTSDASNNFEFKDKARKRLRAFEYWGYWDIQGDGDLVSIVATWVGNTLIRLEENPFPHGRIPFSVATYMPVKKSVYGEPDAELLRENQESVGKMSRAIHDTTAQLAVGQTFIDENFFPSPSQKNAYDKGNTVYYRSQMDPSKAIHKLDVQNLGSTPFDVLQWQASEAGELVGYKPFGGPGGAKNGGDASSRGSMDAVAKRELSVLRRLSDMLFVDMARMTIAMNQVFLSDEEVVRITDKEFVTIKRDDLQGDFDLKVQVSTPERDDDQATKIMKLLQTNAASMDPEISKLHYVKLAELWKIEDLAEAVSSFKPEPSPQEMKMQELQLQEQELKNAVLMAQLEDIQSKVSERISRTSQNERMDPILAEAKAHQAEATAEKLKSETDLLDIAALRIQSGQDRQESIEDQEYKAQTSASEVNRKADIDANLKYLDTSLQRMPAKQVTEI